MVRLNGVEYEYRPELSLGELADDYNLSHAKIGFESCVVIVDGSAITEEQAREKMVCDNETIYIVPKLDGG